MTVVAAMSFLTGFALAFGLTLILLCILAAAGAFDDPSNDACRKQTCQLDAILDIGTAARREADAVSKSHMEKVEQLLQTDKRSSLDGKEKE